MTTDPRVRPLAIAISAVLVTSVLSVGQLKYEQDRLAARDATVEGLPPGETGGVLPTPGETASPGSSASPTSSPSPGSVVPKPGATTPGSIATSRPPSGTAVRVPDFGLRTQGVTPTSVKLGITYNKSGCGDSGALTAALGPAVTGDPE